MEKLKITTETGMREFCGSSLLSSTNGLEVNLKYVAISVGHNSLKTFFSHFPQAIVFLSFNIHKSLVDANLVL